jgi:FKBP-type peptidyl-prolyl cis-trans isomerase
MWKYYNKPVPKFLDSTGYLVYTLKIDSVYSKEKVAEVEKKQMEMQQAMMEGYKMQEDTLLNGYLSANKITVKPTETGLYFVEKKKGTGTKVMAGDSVSVHYKGMLTDGNVFDESFKRGQPITFIAGAGMVIPAWDEALLKMSKGSKAVIVLPSKLGYGPQGSGPIPPFAPLVFEMEVVGIKSAKK